MNTPSLNGFLSFTGAKFRVFDLGIQLKKLPESTLTTLDEGQPYPYPYLGFAWLSLLIWNPDLPEQNSLWFLKLPLDEQGTLPAAVHSDLVNRFYKATETLDENERQRLLTDHPYQFTPDHEKMAALHANATKQLVRSPSNYMENAENYFCQVNSTIRWQELGIQGIADFVCRLKDSDFKSISSRITSFDRAPLSSLLQQFEHRPLPTFMVEQLLKLAQKNSTDIDLVCLCLRACSQSQAKRLLVPFIGQQLEETHLNIEFTLIIITRYLQVLDDEALLMKTLHSLAQKSDDDGFHRVMTHLTQQPGFSGITMKALSSPHLTPTLANALSQLIQNQRHKSSEQH